MENHLSARMKQMEEELNHRKDSMPSRQLSDRLTEMERQLKEERAKNVALSRDAQDSSEDSNQVRAFHCAHSF